MLKTIYLAWLSLFPFCYNAVHTHTHSSIYKKIFGAFIYFTSRPLTPLPFYFFKNKMMVFFTFSRVLFLRRFNLYRALPNFTYSNLTYKPKTYFIKTLFVVHFQYEGYHHIFQLNPFIVKCM